MSTESRQSKVRQASRTPLWLLLAFLLWFAIWAVRPSHPQDFLIEHVLTVALLGVLWLTQRAFPLTNLSYSLTFVFMCLHVVGSHYTYAEVPYERWLASLSRSLWGEEWQLGATFGWKRNHFDRSCTLHSAS
jgi:putative membrane protein